MKREGGSSGKPSGTTKQSGKCKQALKRERPTKSTSNSKGSNKECASDASSKRISSGRSNNKPPSATFEPSRHLVTSKDSKSSYWSASHLAPNPNVSTGLSSQIQKSWKGNIPNLTQHGRIQAPAPPQDRPLKGRRLTSKWNRSLQDDLEFYGPEDADVSDAYESDCLTIEQEKETSENLFSTLDACIPEAVSKHEDDPPPRKSDVVHECTIVEAIKEKTLAVPNVDCLDAEEGVDIVAGIVKVPQPCLPLSEQEDIKVHLSKELNAPTMENGQGQSIVGAFRPMENDDLKEDSSEAGSDEQCVKSFKVECQILREQIEAGDLKTSSQGAICTETEDQDWPETISVAGSDDSWSGIDLSDTECEEWEDDWLIVEECSWTSHSTIHQKIDHGKAELMLLFLVSVVIQMYIDSCF